MGTTTPNFNLYKPAVAETGWGALVDANWDTIDANLTNALPRSYLAGMLTSNNGGSPTTRVDISAGQCQDAANAGAMTLSSTMTKDITGTWAVGSGNGGRGTGVALSATTWYHIFVIKRTDTGVVDAYFDTSISAANIPSPYTLFRRVGSIRTDGGSLILAYTQNGDAFTWTAIVDDIAAVNPGTSAVTRTLTVPTGVQVLAKTYTTIVQASATTVNALLTDLNMTDVAASNAHGQVRALSNGATAGASAPVDIRTNTSAQIRSRLDASNASTTLTISTYGWVDDRGRFA